MKRRDFIRHLEQHGCTLDREGARHTIYRNPANGRCAPVPRHREIKETTARTICNQLEVPRP
ncbi:MAG: type II toxin-antitoxin system HicA family toxin [Pirellulales bacterium]